MLGPSNHFPTSLLPSSPKPQQQTQFHHTHTHTGITCCPQPTHTLPTHTMGAGHHTHCPHTQWVLDIWPRLPPQAAIRTQAKARLALLQSPLLWQTPQALLAKLLQGKARALWHAQMMQGHACHAVELCAAQRLEACQAWMPCDTLSE